MNVAEVDARPLPDKMPGRDLNTLPRAVEELVTAYGDPR
jgi:hypothetical protein